VSSQSENDWLGNSIQPLSGFSWKYGSKRDTTGILIWSDVFLHDSASEKIAIVLRVKVYRIQKSWKNFF
jgi:atlastin